MQNLLRERVPINDVMSILETILDYGPQVKDTDLLTEFARQALSRHITKQYITQDGSIPVFTLDQKYENMLLRSIQTGEAINPDMVNKMVKGLEKMIESESFRGVQPIILTSVQVRRHIRKLMEKFLPSVIVLSNAEISSAGKLYTMGVVKYED
jgi:flagellar biosynthesis protein FlhA